MNKQQLYDYSSTKEISFVDQLVDVKNIKSDMVQLSVWRRKTPNFCYTLSDPSIAPEELPNFEGMVKVDADLSQTIKNKLQSSNKKGQEFALSNDEMNELLKE